jgi:hypothetical protein
MTLPGSGLHPTAPPLLREIPLLVLRFGAWCTTMHKNQYALQQFSAKDFVLNVALKCE